MTTGEIALGVLLVIDKATRCLVITSYYLEVMIAVYMQEREKKNIASCTW